MTTGHESKREADEITVLRQKADAGAIDVRDLLRLALMLFEPAHDPFAAVGILKQVLARDAACDIARVWLAYLNIYGLMDEGALREALAVVGEISSDDEALRAAALLLNGTAMRHLGDMDSSITALQQSVQIANAWVTNRQALADVYRMVDRRAEAAEHLESAREILEMAKKRRSEDAGVGNLFEIYITGRASSDAVLDIIRNQLRALT